MLIAVDFSPVSLQAIRMARQLAPDADPVLVHAFELPYEGKLIFVGVDEQVIRHYVTAGSETRCKRLHDLAEELLLGSVTKHVLSESQCDVLVMCDSRVAPDPSP